MTNKIDKDEELRLSCRAMDIGVERALKAVWELERERPTRLTQAASIMAEIYSTASNACLRGGPTSGQLKAVEALVAKIAKLRS